MAKQQLTLTLSPTTPDSSKKGNEVIYIAEGVGRIYIRKTLFKPDTEPPAELTLQVNSDQPTFAAPGDNPRGGGRAPKALTPEAVAEMEAKAAKAEERLKKQLERLERAKANMETQGDVPF